VIASGAAVFGTIYDVKQFSGTAGLKYNFLACTFRPYATVQAGSAYLSCSGGPTGNGLSGNDRHPQLKPGATDTQDGLTYRGGVGADLQMSHRIYWRMVQWDVQPQPWVRHAPFYNNFSSGTGFRL
jgi:hypothetical protein